MSRCGLCYEGAYHHVRRFGGTLVHGTVYAPNLQRRIYHAWVEDGELVYDYETRVEVRMTDRDEYVRQLRPRRQSQWTFHQALVQLVRTGHYGPWRP